MKYPRQIWDQLKNITAKELIRALKKSGWVRDEEAGQAHLYLHPDGRRVTIHFHPGTTYGEKLLKALLADIAWTEEDLRKLKLIK